MKAADLSSRLSPVVRELAWSQWSALGVSSAYATAAGNFALDLEALILLTLEVGRDEPRLFDEPLDWCHLNHRLISTTRLSNACVDEHDRQAINAMLAWLAAHGRGPRRARAVPRSNVETPALLFPRGAAVRAEELDPSFAAFGLERPVLEPSGKSRRPDLLAPANLNLRLRMLLGGGAMPDVVAALLTTSTPRVQLGVVQAAAGFSTRNVQGALDDLGAGGFVHVATGAGQTWFSADRAAWAGLLQLPESELPTRREWLPLFAAYRRLLRWLRDADELYPTPYLRAGAARRIWADVEPWLQFAGMRFGPRPFAPGEAYWDDFVESVDYVVAQTAELSGAVV